jgi:hypothetical protein
MAPSKVSSTTHVAFAEAANTGTLSLRNTGVIESELGEAFGVYDGSLDDISVLDLSQNKLFTLPHNIDRLVSLEKMVLYHNVIASLPNLERLQSLSVLDLSRNQLTSLPPSICSLPLIDLSLANNQLASLPDSIGSMHTLVRLDLSSNALEVLPDSLGRLTSLRVLSACRNKLWEIPTDICALKLTSLDLSFNVLSEIPVQLSSMTSLETLHLDNNPLHFPPLSVIARGRVHILSFLTKNADGNISPAKRSGLGAPFIHSRSSSLSNTQTGSPRGLGSARPVSMVDLNSSVSSVAADATSITGGNGGEHGSTQPPYEEGVGQQPSADGEGIVAGVSPAKAVTVVESGASASRADEGGNWLTDVLDSVATPGVNASVVGVLFVALGLLFVILMGLIILYGFNVYLLVMTILTVVLIALMAWFLQELHAVKAESTPPTTSLPSAPSLQQGSRPATASDRPKIE